MKKVKINVICLQTEQLLLKDPLKVRCGIYQPDRHFCGQVETVPRVTAQGIANEWLGSTTQIGPGCIVVIDSMLIGIIEHGKGLLLVDGTVLHR